jgi:AmiR/NasT family two-component response regulator
VESRTLIGQATGILMARRGLTADQAFEVLSRTSQNRNIKLARLAALLADSPDLADRI